MSQNFTNYLAVYYLSYLGLCALLVLWVARTLRSSGAVFLHDAFHGDTALIGSVTRLLDIGFYLVCAGYVLITVRNYAWLQNLDQVFQSEVYKIGFFLLLLGAIHLFNLLLLALFRRRTVAKPQTASA
ncbi:MAG: hypothetical protein WCC26_07870 [Terracidiphilus sp.]